MTLSSREGSGALSYDSMGRAFLGLENYAQAEEMFDKALREGSRQHRRRADVFAAQRRFTQAEALLAKAPAGDVYPWIDRISVAADQRELGKAFRNLESAKKLVQRDGSDPIRARSFAVTEATLLLAIGRKAEAAKVGTNTAHQSLQALDRDTPADMPDELDLALSAALIACGPETAVWRRRYRPPWMRIHICEGCPTSPKCAQSFTHGN